MVKVKEEKYEVKGGDLWCRWSTSGPSASGRWYDRGACN